MGQVIALRPSQALQRPAPPSGAEILFFTGVRYYRMTDEEFAKACAPKARAPKARASSACASKRRHAL